MPAQKKQHCVRIDFQNITTEELISLVLTRNPNFKEYELKEIYRSDGWIEEHGTVEFGADLYFYRDETEEETTLREAREFQQKARIKEEAKRRRELTKENELVELRRLTNKYKKELNETP